MVNKKLVSVSIVLVIACSIWFGCDSESENCSDPTAKLFINTEPNDGKAYADGNDSVTITVSGQLENCEPIPSGAEIEFTIYDPVPANVGYFHPDNSTIVTQRYPAQASVEIRSVVSGVVKVSARCVGHNIQATPVEIQFIETPLTDQCSLNLQSDPASVIADGVTHTTITASLTGHDGSPLPDGTDVVLTTTKGTFPNSTQTITVKTQAGAASTLLTSELVSQDTEVEVSAVAVCNDPEMRRLSENVIIQFIAQGCTNTITMPDDCDNIQECFNSMQGGDCLLIRDGRYTGQENIIDDNVPSGSLLNEQLIGANGRPTAIIAENPHQVVFDGEGEHTMLRLINGASNIYINGIKFTNSGARLHGVDHITLKNCGIHYWMQTGTSAERYAITLGISGISDPENGYCQNLASHILVEDCWIWGDGRYGIYFHYTHDSIMRRVVVRTDYPRNNDQQAGIAIYSAWNNIVENCIVFDIEKKTGGSGTQQAIYNTQSSIESCTSNRDNRFLGNIVINNPTFAYRQDPKENRDNSDIVLMNNVFYSILGQTRFGVYLGGDVQDQVFSNNTIGGGGLQSQDSHGGVGIGSGNLGLTFAHNLIIDNIGYGVANEDRGNRTYNNFWNNTYNEYLAETDIAIDPELQFLPDPSRTTSGNPPPTGADLQPVGAAVLLRYHAGTLTNNDLWPFPNQDIIKEDLCDPSTIHYRTQDPEWCTTDKSLSEYIWEHLNFECPADICGDGSR